MLMKLPENHEVRSRLFRPRRSRREEGHCLEVRFHKLLGLFFSFIPTHRLTLTGSATSETPINEIYLPKRSFANEVLHGMSANVERGALGLVPV